MPSEEAKNYARGGASPEQMRQPGKHDPIKEEGDLSAEQVEEMKGKLTEKFRGEEGSRNMYMGFFGGALAPLPDSVKKNEK